MTMKSISCQCGKSIKGNTIRRHLMANYCSSGDEWKRLVVEMLGYAETRPKAWRRSDGVNGVLCRHWWISVLNKDSKMEDWVFSNPRKRGEMRLAGKVKLSEERKGLDNPACKVKNRNYNTEEIRLKAKELLRNFTVDDRLTFKSIFQGLSKSFPDFMYQFCGVEAVNPEKRGHNQQNAVIAYLLDLPIEQVISLNIKRRGLFISKGQKASEKCIESASKMGSQRVSKWRVTKPQQLLFEMVRVYDPDAVMEYRLKCSSRYRSFDIYSPKINTLIEMHGRVWHDYSKDSLRELVTKNIKNDEFKKKVAEEHGKDLLVFWDDQQETWEERVRSIYEKT